MGSVSFSIDIDLVRALTEVFPFTTFVETGTFEGDTVRAVRGLFPEIHTIELSETLYTGAAEAFRHTEGIHVWQGRSADQLRKLRQMLKGRQVLYWLDAHWCVAEGTAGQGSECPLLDELDAIECLGGADVVLIDDARLFLAPPPPPSSAEQWPGLNEVMEKLRALSQAHEIMVVNDVIAYYPQEARGAMFTYAREHGVDWLVMMHRARGYDDLVQQCSKLRSEQEFAQRALEALHNQRQIPGAPLEVFANDPGARPLAETVSARVLVKALARRLLRRANLV